MAAEQLLEALNLANEDIYNRSNVQEAITLLTDTDWNEQVHTSELKTAAIQVRNLLV